MVDDWELPQVAELASKWGIVSTADLKACQWGFEVAEMLGYGLVQHLVVHTAR